MYKVKDIIEPDFGCEGVPEGQEPCCEVLLEDVNGNTKTITVPDAELYRKCITAGCFVEYNNNELTLTDAKAPGYDPVWDRMYSAARTVLAERRISEYVTCGEVAAAVLSRSGRIYTGVCIDTCCTLGICAERNAIFNMITNGEQEIDKVIVVFTDGSKGSPCGACRELMVQLMPDGYKDIEIMTDYENKRIVKLGDITPEWWI